MRPVGLVFPNQLAEAAAALRTAPQEIEAMGYDSIWVTDHVVGTRSMEGVYDSHWLEALSTLTWIAARTEKLRIGTGIIVLPHRDPVMLAKIVTTIDLLSGGRIDLGVGTGWSKVEFRALGVEARFEPRGRVSDESLEVLKVCWAGGPIDFEGDYFNFRHVSFEPKPVQDPHPPIWVGGQSKAALRRTARFGDVWHPHDIGTEELATLGNALDAAAGRKVRRTVRLDVSAKETAELPDLVDAYLQSGCERIVIEFRSLPIAEMRRRSEQAAEALFR